MNRLYKIFWLLHQWAKIVTKQSYYHLPQRLGRAFKPGELAGFYNDLTLKTYWIGKTDNESVPTISLPDGRNIYFTTIIVQKALGHWDNWLLTKSNKEKNEYLKLCRFLLELQDEFGGWSVWSDLGLPIASKYSAMTQGECISAFVRAWKITGEDIFAKSSCRALDLMCWPIEKGGTAIYEADDLFLEEAPSNKRSSILNGWIFALFGLYDFWLAFTENRAYEIFQHSIKTLLAHIREYDAGYWSYYDVQKHLASPFYHDLHVHQLTALAMVVEHPVLDDFVDKWKTYQSLRTNKIKALCVKAYQKLRVAGEVVVIK